GAGRDGPLGALVASAALNCSEARRTSLRQACERLEGAIELVRVALKPNPSNSKHLLRQRYLWEYLAEARLALGEHAAAATAAAAVPAVFGTHGDDHFAAAELLSRCAAMASGDPGLPPEQRATAARGYADRAVEMVRQGIAHGSKDAQRLGRSAFAPLAERADFRELRDSLKQKP